MTAVVIEPVIHGPTWRIDPSWVENDPVTAKYVLPEFTLGWQVIRWIGDNLCADDGSPFKLTFEQKRFLLWWYAVNEDGRWLYRGGVLQRLKGWGKDPVAAVIACVEFLGPCRFGGWAAQDMPDMDLERGEPIGIEHPRAWIQIAAVSKDQTVNTMSLFPGLISKKCMTAHGMNESSIGKEIIYAHGGARRIQAVTSSPRSIEGGRPTFVIMNETQWWLANNEGHAMLDVIDGNITKSNAGTARFLSICNGYRPHENSVAQRQREAWEKEEAGLAINTHLLYDSIEAPADAKMTWAKNEDGSEPTEEQIREYIGAVIEAVRGDATWLNVENIVNSILVGTNSVSESRRKYYNQIVTAEDAWLSAGAGKRAVDPLAESARKYDGADQLRCGWLVMPDEEIVMFGDGSKSDDATGLVGCRLSDGYTFTIGVWQKPAGEAGKGWRAPRGAVDARVREAKERFNVVGFWFDPSHAKDDEDATRYWDGLIDEWHRLFKDDLQFWSVKTGDRQHSIMYDMASPERTAQFIAAAEVFREEIDPEVDGTPPSFKIDGHPALLEHLRNAKEYPTRWGMSLWKGHRESPHKIDLAVCAVGARMLRRIALNVGLEEAGKESVFWGG